MTTNRDQERQELVQRLEEREAGISDLIEVYERLESAYIKASQALFKTPVATTSNTTNGTNG